MKFGELQKNLQHSGYNCNKWRKVASKKHDIYCDEYGFMHDDRIFSDNPHDWDAIKNLDITYIGYHELPDFYMELRNLLPRKVGMELFYKGVFKTFKPNTKPATAYNFFRFAKKWDALNESDLEIDYSLKTSIPAKCCGSAEMDAIKSIAKRMLVFLQETAKAKTRITAADLQDAYNKATSGTAQLRKRISLDKVLSDVEFARIAMKWKYSAKIAASAKNKDLSKEMEKRLCEKIHRSQEVSGAKLLNEYAEYSKSHNPQNALKLSMFYFFNDIEDWKSVEYKKDFIIAKKDLFDPCSPFYLNKIIRAVIYTNRFFTVFEHMTISDSNSQHRIVFGYDYSKQDQKWRLADKNVSLPDDSIWFVPDNGFAHIADWHKRMKSR